MKLSVIGLGKLGAVLAGVLAEAGHDVLGIDLNKRAVGLVNTGVAPVEEPGLGALYDSLPEGQLRASSSFEGVADTAVSFIVVPTPSDEDGVFSNDFVVDAIERIGDQLAASNNWHTVVVCSTVMPGSMANVIAPALERASGRTIGQSVGLCYSPEFIALGSVIRDMKHPDLVLVGARDARSATDLLRVTATYVDEEPVHHMLSWTEAELAKISVNSYVTMKIAFSHTIAGLAEHLVDVDARRVCEAIGDDSRIGSKYLMPGGSFGGPCFPRDNEAFAALGRQLGLPTPLAVATDLLNDWVVTRVAGAVVDHDKVAILGLTYKPGTGVTEQSMGMRLLHVLQDVDVSAHDPLALTDSIEDVLAGSTAVIIATPHAMYGHVDFGDRLVIDCWGIARHGSNIQVLGRSQ